MKQPLSISWVTSRTVSMLFHIAILSSVLFGWLLTSAFSAETKQPSTALYRDKNKFFVALPPTMWSQEDYPNETVRSKVAFRNPNPKNVNIRITAQPADATLNTVEKLERHASDKLTSELKRVAPQARCEVSKKKVNEREMVVCRNTVPGTLEQELALFVHGGVYYNIAFNTGTKEQFAKFQAVFQEFLENFTPVEKERKFTDGEIRAGIASAMLRRAELTEQTGNISEARRIAAEGLNVDPTSEKLKELKRRLDSKGK